MRRPASAEAGARLADADLSRLRAHRHHGPGAAVAERARRPEALLHFAQRRDEALLAESIEHQLYLVGTLLRLLQQAHAGLRDLHSLRTDADERVVIAHQHVAGSDCRNRHLTDVQGAVAQVMAALVHAATASGRSQPAQSALTLPTAASLPSSSTNTRCQISRPRTTPIPPPPPTRPCPSPTPPPP